MKPYLIIPLTADGKERKTLGELVKGIVKDDVNRFSFKHHAFENYHFVRYDGTPTNLSQEIVKQNKGLVIEHIVVSMDSVNVAGYGPNDFVQWANYHGT